MIMFVVSHFLRSKVHSAFSTEGINETLANVKEAVKIKGIEYVDPDFFVC